MLMPMVCIGRMGVLVVARNMVVPVAVTAGGFACVGIGVGLFVVPVSMRVGVFVRQGLMVVGGLV